VGRPKICHRGLRGERLGEEKVARVRDPPSGKKSPEAQGSPRSVPATKSANSVKGGQIHGFEVTERGT